MSLVTHYFFQSLTRIVNTQLLFVVLISCLWINLAHSANLEAEDVVRQTTLEILYRLDSERNTLARNPEYIETIVEDLAIPHFDFETMSRLVFGQYWRKINTSRHKCLTTGFRNMLVERYADILLSYNNQEITHEPARPVGKKGYVAVRQTISRDGARPLAIDYPMHAVQEGWKVADIVIDGVSLVRNYQGIFRYEIDRYGLEKFIQSFPECEGL